MTLAAPPIRVGVDLLAVRDVSDAVSQHGDRYLLRLFTEHELATCRGPRGPIVESLAGRFAAKEAVVKVLQPEGARPAWRDIEIRRLDSGACDVVLRGRAATLADEHGIGGLSLAMSHEAGLAVAVVVAACAG